jgi:hypothetical protein
MQTFFLAVGLAVAALGAMVGDVWVIAAAIVSICLTCLIPDGV